MHKHAMDVAGSYGRAILLRDLNLDMEKRHKSYYRHSLLQDHLAALEVRLG